MSLVWISKATVLCIEEEWGQIQDFLMGGGHQTIREFILSFPAFVPKHGNLGRAKLVGFTRFL